MPKSASDSPTLAPSRKHDVQTPHEAQIVVAFDDNGAASALVGPYGQNLALIERRLGVVADSRGNHITIAGSRDGCDAARRVLEMLYEQAVRSQDIAQGDVEGAIRAVIAQGSLFEFVPYLMQGVRHALQDMGCRDIPSLHKALYASKLRFEPRSLAAQAQGGVHGLYSYKKPIIGAE